MIAWISLVALVAIGGGLRWWWAGRQQGVAPPPQPQQLVDEGQPEPWQVAGRPPPALLVIPPPGVPGAPPVPHPTLATVVLHNDATTPMDVVVLTLNALFGLTPQVAIAMMLDAHRYDLAPIALLPPDEAAALVEQASALMRNSEMALRFSIIPPAASEA
ncbi:MAG TPA: ATP-dependent Clp protease adaptor ClpS [Herpetosiphonaceae bacterium]